MHLIEIDKLNKIYLEKIYEITDEIKSGKKFDILSGKNAIVFFPESSIRTRISFEIAIKELGGNIVLFPPESLDKKEKISDVVGYINNWIDLAVIRHSSLDLLKEIGQYADFPIINAMTKENHPCEIISDFYTLKKQYKNISELKFCFVGIKGNICNSWLTIAKLMKLNFTQISPIEYKADEIYFENNDNINHSEDIDDISNCDIILTDSWPDDVEVKEKMRKYQINSELMKKAGKNSIVNPCPPFYRGEEISEDIINSDHFVSYGFKKNLLDVQKAIIVYCFEK